MQLNDRIVQLTTL